MINFENTQAKMNAFQYFTFLGSLDLNVIGIFSSSWQLDTNAATMPLIHCADDQSLR